MKKSILFTLSCLLLSGCLLAQKTGKMKYVAVGDEDNIWAVSADNRVWRWNGMTWAEPTNGRLRQVDASADGGVWGVSSDDKIWRLNGTEWLEIGGALKQVAVGNSNAVWGTNAANEVWRWNGTAWEQPVQGSHMKQVDVADDGTVWAVAANDGIFRFTGYGWEQVNGSLMHVAIGSSSSTWGVNAGNQVWHWVSGSWQEHVPTARLKQVDVGIDDTAWGVAPDNSVWKWNGSTWVTVIPSGPMIDFKAAVVVPVVAVSQVNSGNRNAGVIVFEHAGFAGASKTLTADWNVPMDPSWNDKISSIKIPAGYTVQVFEHGDYQGASMTFTNDWTVTSGNLKFNDIISSIKILTYPSSDKPSFTAYQDANFTGQSIKFEGDWDVATSAIEWNDRISSIRVPAGYTVQVFEHANFQGATMNLNSDWTVAVGNLNFNDIISSIKFYPTNSQPVYVEPVKEVVIVPTQTDYVVRTLRDEYAPEESIVVEYSGFPGKGGEWLNVVAAGKRDDDWGNFQYTKGTSGKLKFEFLSLPPGEYEVRAYAGALDYEVKGRFKFIIK